jgi:hypothetical protein
MLSPSHRRSSHETFLAVVAPFVRPFRCASCNWRGMMGRFSFVPHNNTNIFINATIFIALVILAIWGFSAYRSYKHPYG